MKLQTVKDILLIVLLFAMGMVILGGNHIVDNYKDKQKEFIQTQLKLREVISRQDSVHKIEKDIRDKQRSTDSTTIANLKHLREHDSLTHIRTVSQLIKLQKNLSNEELDLKVEKIYEEITHN